MAAIANPAFLYPDHPLLAVVQDKEIELAQMARKIVKLTRQLEAERTNNADLLAQLRAARGLPPRAKEKAND